MFQKTNFICILLFWNYYVSYSQDIQTEINIIAKHIESVQSVAIEAEVHMYASKGGTKLFSTHTGMYKSGSEIKSVLGELDYLETSSYYVQVDNEEKAILILKKKDISKNYSKSNLQLDIKKLQEIFKKDESVNNKFKSELLSENNGIKSYRISGLSGIQEMIIELNVHKKKLISVVYKYDKTLYSGQYVEIVYTKFDFNTDLSLHFDLRKYFVITNSGYLLSEKYNNYKIYTEL